MKPIEKQLEELRTEFVQLISTLIPEIHDDMRATDDPDDTEPGLCLTIGFTPAGQGRWDEARWAYQTGDNSFTGGAYGHPHWAVIYLSRDTDPHNAADEAIDQILELCAQ